MAKDKTAAKKFSESFGKEVREQLEKHEQIQEAAKEAYSKGKTGEPKEKTEKKKADSGKFEMLPSEKAKADKKEKHHEDKKKLEVAKKEAVKTIAREEA